VPIEARGEDRNRIDVGYRAGDGGIESNAVGCDDAGVLLQARDKERGDQFALGIYLIEKRSNYGRIGPRARRIDRAIGERVPCET